MSNWESYHARIRSTEVGIQNKLQLLNQYSRSIDTNHSDVESLSDNYIHLKNDITVLFKNYKSYLESMETISKAEPKRTYLSILNRQKEVLDELVSEYKRVNDRILVKRNRYELFHQRSGGDNKEESDMQLLLKERTSVRQALHLADEYIDQASASHQSLLGQRKTLGSSQNKILGIINRVPGVNSLMRNIQNRKNKDNYIVGGFIGLLVCFCIWYVWK